MMRFLGLFVAAVLTATAADATARVPAAANFDAFGPALLQQLAAVEPHQNTVISPLSIGIALSMTADGAAGATRAQIAHVLHAASSDDLGERNTALLAALHENHDAEVGIANALWLRQDIPPSKTYQEKLRRDYGAQAQALRFGDPSAAETINAWTKTHTLGLIDRIVDRTSPNDFAYLTNALTFQGKWTLPFKKAATHRAPFTNAGGQSHPVDMMTNTATYKEGDELNFRVVRLPYGNGGYAAYILLPQAPNADVLVKELKPDTFERIQPTLRETRLQLSLPRFTAQYDASLVPALKSLGMTDAFSVAADFSPMHAPPPHLIVSSVRHASYVRVDEAGTVAAAATSAGISLTSVEIPPATFVVDHPFVFAIRDERAGELLFLGVINQV